MSVITVEADDAALALSRLIASVERGDEVVFARDGEPVARLVREGHRYREPGSQKGKVWISDDFDGPLPDDMIDAIEGPLVPDDDEPPR